MGVEEAQKPLRSLHGAAIRAAALVFFDVFLVNQGVISILVGHVVTFVSLPYVILSKRYKGKRWVGVGNIGIYLAAVFCVLLLNAQFNSIARDRADTVVAAIKSFYEANNRYPNSLAALIPEYLDGVPYSKPTIIFNSFSYRHTKDATHLMYIDLPPFGRPYFDFEDNRWKYMD